VLRAAPLPADMLARLADNRALFPCGVDLILVTADEVAALPRSVRLAVQEGA
jgi:alpha-D-ribose 1-methylphosphonate 5-triphosphate synthase subunit PhnH